MVKKIVLCAVLLFPFYIRSQEQDNQKTALAKVKNVSLTALKMGAKLYAATFVTSLANTYAHEYGHALTYQFLFNVPSTVTIDLSWDPLSIRGVTMPSNYQGVIDKNNFALVALAGPVAGLAACWAMLKMNTFLNCYLQKRNKLRTVKFTDKPDSLKALLVKESWSVISALKKTFNKEPLINHHQLPEFQIGLLAASVLNINSLIPAQEVRGVSGIAKSDVDVICQILLGKSLYDQSPDFWKKIEYYVVNAWIWTGLGYIFFVHEFKKLQSMVKASLVLRDDKNPYTHFTLREAKRKLEKLQEKHFIRKLETQGKKLLLAEHIADLENN